ncbi:cation:proton antiporter [Sorangium cellulosum]|uniref:Cation:proton antiporter n=1 Tax=Sorangium cellulosum TaxID=56 RepID=A0A2L0ERY5_SORCE|nr:proton-conducting transporter membrane subunit [Sorangium cellulosum]AUX42061.1 cation:proton antiporter [Sorangium cellulosum]
MNAAIVAIPVLLPLFTAVLLALISGRPRLERWLSLASSILLCATALVITARTTRGAILVLAIGSWSPRVGIVWVTDSLAALMLLFAAIVAVAALAYAPGSLRGARERRYFYPLQQLMMAGVNGSLVTGDLFNLFVFFELMLLSSFALLALGTRAAGFQHTLAYVVMNLVASALLLGGVGAVYGTAGTVNMAELAVRVREGDLPVAFWGAEALVIVVFMVKAALAPVFFWLPDAYPEASVVVNGLFAGLLTKVGVYTLFRSVPLLCAAGPGGLRPALLVIAAATMIIGVVGALGRSTIRGVLSFHIVSQVGYMIFGLALFTPLAVAAGLFHTIHNMVAKTALIFAGGIAERIGRSGKLFHVRGLARTHPFVAAGFFVPAMSLAGLPPLSGFWGKLLLVVAGFRAGAFLVTTVSLVVGLLTLASMLKIWSAVFWGEPIGQRMPRVGRDRGMVSATLGLGALTVLLGVAVAPIFAHLERTAATLLEVTPYVDAVLGQR